MVSDWIKSTRHGFYNYRISKTNLKKNEFSNFETLPSFPLFEVQFPYNPSCSSVGRSFWRYFLKGEKLHFHAHLGALVLFYVYTILQVFVGINVSSATIISSMRLI